MSSYRVHYKRGDIEVEVESTDELLERFNIRIRYETVKQDEDWVKVLGGLCLLRGEYVLILNSNTTAEDRIEILGRALKHFDLDQIYIRPVLREFLDEIPQQTPFSVGHCPNPR
jgi:hypothetical protein